MAEEEQSPKPQRKSRREFLKLAGASVVATPLVIANLERSIISGLANGLVFPRSTELAITTAIKASEIDSNFENPQARKISDVVKEGIIKYEGESGDKVFFERSNDYRDVHYYGDLLNKISRAVTLPKDPRLIIQELVYLMPGEARLAFFSSNQRFTQFENIFVAGSGFYERLIQKYPNDIKDFDKIFHIMQSEGLKEIQEVKSFVEKQRARNNSPLSSSEILIFYLDKNKGNLGLSMTDTAVFLKFMARSDFRTAKASYTEEHVDWFRKNIKDEYKGQSYNDQYPLDVLVNLIGKPYHSWNLISLLQFFPVEVIQAAGMYRQLITLPDQGIGKTRADLFTLEDLKGVEFLCLKSMTQTS